MGSVYGMRPSYIQNLQEFSRVASTREEIAVTAGIISAFLRIPWVEARKLSESMFEKADENLNLSNALVSAHGFPQIFNRLKEANVPYCIATSDTLMRVHDSFAIYDLQLPEVVVTPEMVNKGKPAPDMLKFIEQKSGVPINEMAMVGDSCVDMQMATFAGAIGIGIPETEEMRKAMEPYASVIINSLDEIEILGDIT